MRYVLRRWSHCASITQCTYTPKWCSPPHTLAIRSSVMLLGSEPVWPVTVQNTVRLSQPQAKTMQLRDKKHELSAAAVTRLTVLQKPSSFYVGKSTL